MTSQVTNVLVVPTTAVTALARVSYVDLLKNGKEVEQPVTVGTSSGEFTQIKSGLKSGQEVVIASLRAGSPRAPAPALGADGLAAAVVASVGGGFGGGGGGAASPGAAAAAG